VRDDGNAAFAPEDPSLADGILSEIDESEPRRDTP